jgi:hypothetical protein
MNGTYSVQPYLNGARDDKNRVRATSPQHINAAFRERLPVQLDQRLGPAESGALPGGEQHSGNTRWHGIRWRGTAWHRPQAYALALVASIRDQE